MTDESIHSETIDEIISNALGIDQSEFEDSTDLGPEGLGVDSITIVEIVELVEMETGIAISDEDLDRFDGGTVADLKGFVEQQAESAA